MLKEYKILGARCIAVKSLPEYKNYITNLVKQGKGGYSVAINAEKVMLYQKNDEIKNIIDNSILPSPDGVGALIGLKFLHGIKSIKVDLPKTILEIANENANKLYILGATKEVNDLAKATILQRYPNILLVGNRDGFFTNEAEVIDEIVALKPEFIMLALGTPKQEILAKKINKKLANTILIGCGGAFDVLAGKVNRAPMFFQNLHLEWFYRLVSNPTRIKRQKVLPIFLLKILKASIFK